MKGAFESTDDRDAETAVLVAVQLPRLSDEDVSESIRELEALARTAGARVTHRFTQRRNSYDPATVLGKGKVGEVKSLVRSSGARLVIFDNELTITQQERLQDTFDAKVIDRTALILDIFAQHAHTKEGKTQVELAQLSYLFPRIRGRGLELSRLGGGIGTRGPGETKLEEDRRRIRKRMRKLRRDLTQMESVRTTQRKQRIRAGLPSICLVGYTNSGKSTVLNQLTGASVLVGDSLFSTLDSTTRKLVLPDGRKIVLSDTVGFIRNLPHELVAAFHSTLEVVREADLLIHVVDSMRENTLNERLEAVKRVLVELDTSNVPRVTVFNKIDMIEPSQGDSLKRIYPDSLLVSALNGNGLGALLQAVSERLPGPRFVTLAIPAALGDVVSTVYRDGSVADRRLEGDMVLLTARLPAEKIEKYRSYLLRR